MKVKKRRSSGDEKRLRNVVLTLTTIFVLLAWTENTAMARTAAQIVTNRFDYKDFERFGSGYRITIENKSKDAFTNFLVIVMGLDINDVTVYQKEICVEFMKGRSEKTFFLDGYENEIFRIKIKVVDWLYSFGCNEEKDGYK